MSLILPRRIITLLYLHLCSFFIANEPLILLGDIETFQVRADIDEVNAPLVVPRSPAVAYLKGRTEQAISLTFDRIEPYIVPKRSLTGDNRERVDTRVLQVIYQFEKPAFPIYVGQQVDVFIERAEPRVNGIEEGTEMKMESTDPPTIQD